MSSPIALIRPGRSSTPRDLVRRAAVADVGVVEDLVERPAAVVLADQVRGDPLLLARLRAQEGERRCGRSCRCPPPARLYPCPGAPEAAGRAVRRAGRRRASTTPALGRAHRDLDRAEGGRRLGGRPRRQPAAPAERRAAARGLRLRGLRARRTRSTRANEALEDDVSVVRGRRLDASATAVQARASSSGRSSAGSSAARDSCRCRDGEGARRHRGAGHALLRDRAGRVGDRGRRWRSPSCGRPRCSTSASPAPPELETGSVVIGSEAFYCRHRRSRARRCRRSSAPTRPGARRGRAARLARRARPSDHDAARRVGGGGALRRRGDGGLLGPACRRARRRPGRRGADDLEPPGRLRPRPLADRGRARPARRDRSAAARGAARRCVR